MSDATGQPTPNASLTGTPAPTVLFALSGESAQEVGAALGSLRQTLAHAPDAELAAAAAQWNRADHTHHPRRVALAGASVAELSVRAEAAAGLLQGGGVQTGQLIGGAKEGFWIGLGLPPRRVAFLFPGQGSQQVNMARRLVERFPWARALVAQADTWAQEAGGEPISAVLFRPVEAGEAEREGWRCQLSQTEVAQPAVCLASLLWATFLRRLGVVPVAVGGHSLGELSAFCVAGAFEARDLLRLATIRGRAMAAPPGAAGAMASLACSREQAEAIVAQAEGYVTVANLNSPRQSVISGERPSVQQAVALATQAGLAARELAVSNAFHSRLVAGAAEYLRVHAPLPEYLGTTSTQLLSGMDGRPVPPGTDLRQYFSRQVLSRVDFIAMVQSLAELADVMVEVGPGKVLSGLVRQIRGSSGPACLPVEALAGSDQDLRALLATLFVHQHALAWEEL